MIFLTDNIAIEWNQLESDWHRTWDWYTGSAKFVVLNYSVVQATADDES